MTCESSNLNIQVKSLTKLKPQQNENPNKNFLPQISPQNPTPKAGYANGNRPQLWASHSRHGISL